MHEGNRPGCSLFIIKASPKIKDNELLNASCYQSFVIKSFTISLVNEQGKNGSYKIQRIFFMTDKIY